MTNTSLFCQVEVVILSLICDIYKLDKNLSIKTTDIMLCENNFAQMDLYNIVQIIDLICQKTWLGWVIKIRLFK